MCVFIENEGFFFNYPALLLVCMKTLLKYLRTYFRNIGEVLKSSHTSIKKNKEISKLILIFLIHQTYKLNIGLILIHIHSLILSHS